MTTPPTPAQRASDAERESAAELLRAAGGEGRLDPDELEQRLEAAYSARTVGELATLTEDLPDRHPDAPGREPVWRSEELRARLATFIVANFVCITVWLATGADGSFWPKWVLLGTGIAVVATLVPRLLGVEKKEHDGPRPPLPPAPPGLPGSPRRRP
jgi:hypothetical protein